MPTSSLWRAMLAGVLLLALTLSRAEARPLPLDLAPTEQAADSLDDPSDTLAPAVPGVSLRAPILFFHGIGSSRGFEDDIASLLRAGYTPVNLDAVVDRLEGKPATLPARPVVITFDDGLLSQYQFALPVLQRYAVPATFFVIPTYQDGVHSYMTEQQWIDLVAAGMRVESHTFTHTSLGGPKAGSITPVLRDVRDSGRYVQNVIRQAFPTYQVRVFAYPNGSYTAAVSNLVREVGYDAAVTTSQRATLTSSQLTTLPRIRADGLTGARLVQLLRSL